MLPLSREKYSGPRLQEAQQVGALWPSSPRLFEFRASETCRLRRDTHYTPGLPSFSGVLHSFIPSGTFRARESDRNLTILTVASPSWKHPTEGGSLRARVSAAPESRRAALQSFVHLRTTAGCAPPAAPAQSTRPS